MTTTTTALALGDRWVTRCFSCRIGHAHDGLGIKPKHCECGATLGKWTPVRGYISDHKCGPRCTSAVGPTCDCECGGHRHGIDLFR